MAGDLQGYYTIYGAGLPFESVFFSWRRQLDATVRELAREGNEPCLHEEREYYAHMDPFKDDFKSLDPTVALLPQLPQAFRMSLGVAIREAGARLSQRLRGPRQTVGVARKAATLLLAIQGSDAGKTTALELVALYARHISGVCMLFSVCFLMHAACKVFIALFSACCMLPERCKAGIAPRLRATRTFVPPL